MRQFTECVRAAEQPIDESPGATFLAGNSTEATPSRAGRSDPAPLSDEPSGAAPVIDAMPGPTVPIADVADAAAGIGSSPVGTLTLPFARRQKARQRARLDSGEEIAVLLPRGTVMRGGDRLVSMAGHRVMVVAAEEAVSTVCCDDARDLARIAYHLGNRHIAVQVGSGWLRYLADHVLDDMVAGLGAEARRESAPFEPEGGAYGNHGHSHAHGHDHAHGQTPAKDHALGHDHDHEPGQAPEHEHAPGEHAAPDHAVHDTNRAKTREPVS